MKAHIDRGMEWTPVLEHVLAVGEPNDWKWCCMGERREPGKRDAMAASRLTRVLINIGLVGMGVFAVLDIVFDSLVLTTGSLCSGVLLVVGFGRALRSRWGGSSSGRSGASRRG